MRYCVNCLNPESRPRLTFDKNGLCSACQYHVKKYDGTINFKDRSKQFKRLISNNKTSSPWDCIVPCSGGKDGSTVAYKLKFELGLNPLCVTFMPPMQTWIGRQNLENFKNTGFDHIAITPDVKDYKQFNKDWFIKAAMPKQAFVIGISTSVLRIASAFDIRTVVWGENAEAEYGGNLDAGSLEKFNRNFLIDIYYEGQDDSEKYGPWWKVPTQKELDRISNVWWSYYEPWSVDGHARLAKKHCGLELLVGGNIGTFTNASQLDDIMQDLHCFCQFIKFGFSRCLSDASIEVRDGRLKRSEGVRIVNELDGLFPLEYLDAYLSYFDMTEDEFWKVIDKFANMDLLEKTDNPEKPYELKTPCV